MSAVTAFLTALSTSANLVYTTIMGAIYMWLIIALIAMVLFITLWYVKKR